MRTGRPALRGQVPAFTGRKPSALAWPLRLFFLQLRMRQSYFDNQSRPSNAKGGS